MNKLVLGISVAIIVLIGAFFALNSYIYNEKQGEAAQSHMDATYVIEGQLVTLKNGFAETEAAPGSASKTTTNYFGNEVRHDFDNDGREDIVFLLTQERGGSGTFYYVVAALNKETGYEGSQALLLGDRIAPQTTEKGTGNIIIVNYAERAPGEDFSAQPSVGKSIWLILDAQTMQFGEVAQNFEGEANPSTMTLPMKTWVWISALYNDEREVKPAKPAAFTITFSDDKKFTATTDCNQMGGAYAAKDGLITFSDIYMTKMFCEGSQESVFATLLRDSSGYHFTSRGELILDLKFDSGSVIFK